MIEEWKKKFPNSFLQTFKDDKEHGRVVCKRLSESSEGEVKNLNEIGSGIFFTPNGFSKDTSLRTEACCDLLNYWFVDIEGYPKQEQIEQINSFPLSPTMVVETKNGHHCYWKIIGKSPYWYKVIDLLIEYFGSDMAISSTNEVLRIPGYLHQKDRNAPFMIKLLSENDSGYTEENMLSCLGEKKITKRLRDQTVDFFDDIEEIKAIPIRVVLDKLGVRHERNVIFEDGKKTSALIHPTENYIHRFSGKPGSGSVIDAVKSWGNAKDNAEAIEWIRNAFNIKRKILKRKATTTIESEYFIDSERMASLVADRIEGLSNNDVIKFHIPELNRLITGIYPTDLVVIGADTGLGKSQFLVDLAYNACKNGARVAYFDLENDDGDMILRQIAKKVSIKTKQLVTVNHIRTRECLTGSIGECVMESFDEVVRELGKNIMFYNNTKIPTIEEFLKSIQTLRDGKGCDMVVVDHLHYFEMDDKDIQAIQIGKIMRELRMLTKSRVPVVIASHLKPRAKRADEPTNYDLFGSSNISKEAGVVILLSKNEAETTLHLTKNRSGGGITEKLCGKFNYITREVDFIKQEKQVGFDN